MKPKSKHPAHHLSAADPVLGAVIAAAGPYALTPQPGRPPFLHLARSIAHQQLNGTAADTIFRRFIALFPDPAGGSTEMPFPSPEQVLAMPDDRIRSAGFSGSKTVAVKDLATQTLKGVVPDLSTLQELENEAIIERLTTVRGVGRWTVEMMLMFQLGRPDVLPVADFGVCNGFRLAYGLRGMPRPAALAAYGERWAPHRTAAAWYLWRAVDLSREGRLPAPPRPAPRLALVKRKAAAPKPKAATKPKSAAKPKLRAQAGGKTKGKATARTRRKAGKRQQR